MSTRQPMKILIVDDNAPYREAFKRAILLEGHEVCEAADTDEALSAVLEQAPQVVVTDLQMRTEREGLDLIEIVRGYDPLLPVIMISGVGSFEEGALATQLGATHVIHKSRIEDEMEGFFTTVRTAHEACCKSRAQLALVAAARDQGRLEESDERIGPIKALLADPMVDPYIKSEAFDFIATLGDAELLVAIQHVDRLGGVEVHFVTQPQEEFPRLLELVHVFLGQDVQGGQLLQLGRSVSQESDPADQL